MGRSPLVRKTTEERQMVNVKISMVVGLAAGLVMMATSSAHADPFYRLHNPNTQSFFYTVSIDEAVNAIEHGGWIWDGPVAACFTSPQPGTAPFYRVSAPAGNVNFIYTTSIEVVEILEAKGSHLDGVACDVYPGPSAGACPLYQAHYANGHDFYTLSWSELLNTVALPGAAYDGVVAYLLPASGTSCPQ
jgi:hypothetical protein